MQKRRVKKAAFALITAAICLLLFGCQSAAVQTLSVALATPSPMPEVVSLGENGEQSEEVYGITVLSPNDWVIQEDGTIVTQDGQPVSVLATNEPTNTPVLTPTPVPTAPPPTPTPMPTPVPTASPTPTEKTQATATPKITAKPTSTPKPTATPTPTPTATPGSWGGDTSVPTATPTPTATPVSTQSAPSVSGSYSGEDVLLAARVAYFESGRTEEGYLAVLCVVLNRVESSRWPDTVYDVVFQKYQFTVVDRSDFLTKTIPDSVIGYANDVFNNGNRILPAYVMSFRSATTEKIWGTRTFYGTYGGNDFYY